MKKTTQGASLSWSHLLFAARPCLLQDVGDVPGNRQLGGRRAKAPQAPIEGVVGLGQRQGYLLGAPLKLSAWGGFPVNHTCFLGGVPLKNLFQPPLASHERV